MIAFFQPLGLLFILYLIKIYYEQKIILEKIVRIEEFEDQFKNVKHAYFEAIILSYIYSVGSVYATQIDAFLESDAFSIILAISKLVIPIYLIHIQNRHKNGVANDLDDMSGAVFYLCVVVGSCWFVTAYIVRILVLLNKRRQGDEDEQSLKQLVSTSVDLGLMLLSIFIDDVVVGTLMHFSFEEILLYLAVMLFASEIIIPPICRITTSKIVDQIQQ